MLTQFKGGGMKFHRPGRAKGVGSGEKDNDNDRRIGKKDEDVAADADETGQTFAPWRADIIGIKLQLGPLFGKCLIST